MPRSASLLSESKDWGPEFIREGGKRLEIILEMFNYPDDSNYNVIQNENFILTRKVISTDS